MQKKIGMITLLWVIAVALLGLVTNPVVAQESGDLLPYPEGEEGLLFGGMHGAGAWPGVDYVAECGTILVNPLPGVTTVTDVGRDNFCGSNGCGNSYVELNNGELRYVLMHGEYSVAVGDTLSQGDVIGTEASIGNSDRCHSHISVRTVATGEFIDVSQLAGNPEAEQDSDHISIPFKLDPKRIRWEMLIPVVVAMAIAALLLKVGLLKLRWLFWIIGFVLIVLAFAIPEALDAIGQSGAGRIVQFLSELAQGKPDMYLGVDWNRTANASLALGVASLALAWFFPSLSDLKKLLLRGKQELPYPWGNKTAIFNSLKLAVFGSLWLSAWSVDSPFGKFLLSVPLVVTLLYVAIRLMVARRWNRNGTLLLGKHITMFAWGIFEMASAIWLVIGLASFVANPSLAYAKREPVIPTVWNVRWPQILPKLVKVERTGGTYTSQLPEFEITYWNGAPVRFYAPKEVWDPLLEASKEIGCDPLLVLAVAHSESSTYNNTAVSPVGAAGVWQFMPGTWAHAWNGTGELPDRTDIPRAAEAACRHIQNDLGFADETEHDSFVAAFTGADGSWTWNQHEPQADYVWRLWTELKNQTATVQTFGVSDYTIEFESVEVDFQKFLNSLNLALGERMLISENAGEFALPYTPGTFVVTQGEHGASYNHAAVDLAGGANTLVIAPINGVVTVNETNDIGNTVLQIEGDGFVAELLHGNWDIAVGTVVSIGDPVGTEANHGYTFDMNGNKCGTGSDCGYHTHFNLVDKTTGQSVYPKELIGE
jgi:murein DD-endopeptidase MepM/ murein hydrolase activator NlpD